MEDKDTKLMDQSELANSISDKIPFEFAKQFLVKPLDPIKVKKEFDKPVSKDNKPTTDENGIEAVDYDEVETEVKEVDSDYRKGIVLKVPYDYNRAMNDEKYPVMPINIGDIVLFHNRTAVWFDILKDTQLISPFDIVGIVSNEHR